jgi:hypothetical protein
VITASAITQRQNACCTGGTLSCGAREVTKEPDQTTVARAARAIPRAGAAVSLIAEGFGES